MKLATLAVLLVTTQATYAAAQARHAASAPAASATEEIRQIEEQRNQAILHGDVATLDRLTADDYTFVTLRGELRTKAEVLEGFRSGSFHYDSRRIYDLKIRTFGNTAVVTGRSVQHGAENGKDYSGDYWFTRVYVKQDGRWVTVALQTTLVQHQARSAGRKFHR